MATWKKIEETSVCLNFACKTCDHFIALGPQELVYTGNPLCLDCDRAMEFVEVEIDIEAETFQSCDELGIPFINL